MNDADYAQLNKFREKPTPDFFAKKLVEEVNEFIAKPSLEECTDVIITALQWCYASGFKDKQIDDAQKTKISSLIERFRTGYYESEAQKLKQIKLKDTPLQGLALQQREPDTTM